MKSRIQVTKGTDGYIESGSIYQGNRKKVAFTHTWDAAQLLDHIEFTGALADLPTAAEMYQMASQNNQADHIIHYTANIWKIQSSNAAGNAVVWTPQAGNKYRLLGFILSLSMDTTTAAALAISLHDSTSPSNIFQVVISNGAIASLPQPIIFAYTLPGDGYLANLKDNVLYLNLTTALTTGVCLVSAFGTEEGSTQ